MRELFSKEASSTSKDTLILTPSNSKGKTEKLDVKSLTKEELLVLNDLLENSSKTND